MAKLTAAKIKSLTKPKMHGDGGGLYLRVAPGGSKQWVQRIVVNGKRRDLGLGGYPLRTLAEARDIAFQNRRAARLEGRDIMAEKRRAAVPTFKVAAERFYQENKAKWKSEKHAKNWIQIVSKYAFSVIGERRVDEITRADVLSVLTPIWTAKAETAKRLRRYIRNVFAAATAHGWREDDPADERISAALPRTPKVAAHFRALPYGEISGALEIIESCGASDYAKLAIRFLVLTAARSGEVRGAKWAEIDMANRTWKIPGERMKSGREHRVPLSDEAVAVLEKAREIADGGGFIFPSPVRRGQPMSDMTMTKIMRDTGLASKATIHGMRSAFRDWAAEIGQPREIAEAALAHAVGGVEGSYFRSDLFEQRRNVMAEWGVFVEPRK